MSVLDQFISQVTTRTTRQAAAQREGVDLTTVQAVLAQIAPFFWSWYDSNQGLKITSIHVWIISRTIYVRDLMPLFVLLFGSHP